MLFLVLVYVFYFDLFEFLAAILEKGLFLLALLSLREVHVTNWVFGNVVNIVLRVLL